MELRHSLTPDALVNINSCVFRRQREAAARERETAICFALVRREKKSAR